jgi:hypothetical protein
MGGGTLMMREARVQSHQCELHQPRAMGTTSPAGHARIVSSAARNVWAALPAPFWRLTCYWDCLLLTAAATATLLLYSAHVL